ncbi:MAG: hypothetical protein AB8F78_19770 [Saprospiraceae bacterium]
MQIHQIQSGSPSRLLTTLLFSLLYLFAQAQPGDMPPNPKPGQCYAKCLISPLIGTTTISIAVYLGTDSTIIKQYTVDTTLITEPIMRVWVKKAADKGCLSADPKDCLVWCLVESEVKTIRIQRYLLDTTVTSEFISQDRDIISEIEPGGYTEWHRIVCGQKVTSKLVQRIRKALGMEEDKSIRIMNSATKAALVQYQRDNNLPLGQIDIKSLKHLGVKLPR